MTIDRLMAMAKAHARPQVRPSVSVTAKTASEQQKVVEAARKVINTHRDVLIALKDR